MRLAAMETDDCIIWPYAKAGQRKYGQVHVKGNKAYAHELALSYRIGPRPPGMYVLHGPCGDPACMNYRHLRYGTPTQNNLDRRRDNTSPIGERNPMAKLTESDILDIRRRFASGESQRRLAAAYEVSVMTINRAIRGETWTHIPVSK